MLHQADSLLEAQDPFLKKEVYHDGPINSFFIKYFSAKMAEQLGREFNDDLQTVKHMLHAMLPKISGPHETAQHRSKMHDIPSSHPILNWRDTSGPFSLCACKGCQAALLIADKLLPWRLIEPSL